MATYDVEYIRKLQEDPDVIGLVQQMMDQINKAERSPSLVYLWMLHHRIESIRSELDQLLRNRYQLTAEEVEKHLAVPEIAAAIDQTEMHV